MDKALQIERAWEESFYKNISDYQKTLDAEFQIYRHNHYVNLLSTLEFIYPVCKVLIDVDFKKIAFDYTIKNESKSGNLHLYGQSFNEYLSEIKYFIISYIAELEWAMHFAYYAVEEDKIDFNSFLKSVQDGHDFQLKFAKHTRFLSFPITISRLFSEHAEGYNSINDYIESDPESILVTRHNRSIIYCVIDNKIVELFKLISNGFSFLTSIEKAKIEDPNVIQEAMHLMSFYGFVCNFTIDK